MSNNKRMAGDYEIIQSIHVGEREIVLGENPKDKDGQFYLVAYCDTNDLFAAYSDCLVSDSFPELVQIYGQRIAEAAQRTMEQIQAEEEIVKVNIPYNAEICKDIDGCKLVSHNDVLDGKCVILKADTFRREYRTAAHQLKLVTGGFGASPNSRGSALYCTDLLSGQSCRYERRDVLAIIEPEALPDWAAKKYNELTKQKKPVTKEER